MKNAIWIILFFLFFPFLAAANDLLPVPQSEAESSVRVDLYAALFSRKKLKSMRQECFPHSYIKELLLSKIQTNEVVSCMMNLPDGSDDILYIRQTQTPMSAQPKPSILHIFIELKKGIVAQKYQLPNSDIRVFATDNESWWSGGENGTSFSDEAMGDLEISQSGTKWINYKIDLIIPLCGADKKGLLFCADSKLAGPPSSLKWAFSLSKLKGN